jgi:hypothetical protein
LYKNNKGILDGDHMHNDCWTLLLGFGETLVVVDMMTRPIHLFTQPNFLLENQDGVKITMQVVLAFIGVNMVIAFSSTVLYLI